MLTHIAKAPLSKSWSYVSRNPILSGVIASLIATATLGGIRIAGTGLHERRLPGPVERAEVKGGSWGPGRILYWCGPGGQCVAPDHVMFDSIANDPVHGNEAYFMGARVLGTHGPMRNRIDVKVGDVVLVRALIVNDAAMSSTHGDALVAHGTRFSVSLPTNSSSELPLIGHIAAANAVPRRIYDALFLRSRKRFAIEYAWNSAILANRLNSEIHLSPEVVGDGALVGARRADGVFPPGLSHDAAVLFLIHVVPPTL